MISAATFHDLRTRLIFLSKKYIVFYYLSLYIKNVFEQHKDGEFYEKH